MSWVAPHEEHKLALEIILFSPIASLIVEISTSVVFLLMIDSFWRNISSNTVITN